MRIFGSISELVDLAFRLAGGKQVKLKSNTQTTSGSLVTVNVPDVAATGDTQNMVLTAATQSLSNKTLGAGTAITAGTINGAVVGGSTPAAGTFTDIVGSTLDINTSAELQTLTIPSMVTAGILHNNSSGAVSSSLIVNADVTTNTLNLDKLASIGDGKIIIGANGTGFPTSRSMSGDVTIDNLGATTIGASKVTDGMLAGNITRSKLATGLAKRVLVNDNSGVISENPNALANSEAVATDANGYLVSVTGVSATELGYLSGVTSDIQTQIGNKATSGANSDITSLTGLTTMLAPNQGGTGANNGSNTLTLGGPLVTSGNFTTTITATNTTNVTLPTTGTLATTSNKLSAFAPTTSSELAGVISDETGSGALVFGTAPALSNVAITGGTVRGVALDNLRVESDTAAISSSTLTLTKGLMIVTAGENTLATLTPAGGFNSGNGAVLTLINNEGADVTVNNSGNIQTGTGADFTLKQGAACDFIYSTTLSKWVLSGGAGSGGASAGSGTLNIVDNPIAESSTTGWTAATNYTVSRDVANSPLAGIIDSCFAISTTTASSESSTSGVYAASLAMPAALRNTKMQLSMYVNVPASSLGVWRLSVYNSSGTRVSLSSDSSSVTTLPAGFNGQFVCTFDANSGATYTISITQTTRTSANTLYATLISIGNGVTAQGAAISDQVTYTPSNTQGFGTIASVALAYRRVGSFMHISGRFTTGTVAASQAQLSLPTGYTIGSIGGGSSIAVVGKWSQSNGSGSSLKTGVVLGTAGNTYLNFSTDDYTLTLNPFTAQNGNAANLFFSSNPISFDGEVIVPIAEWAGNGTVNLGQGAQVEYAFNNGGTWDADNNSSFAYGPAGQLLGGALTAGRLKRVRFQSPIQSDDLLIIEGSDDRNTWYPLANAQVGGVQVSGSRSTAGTADTSSGVYYRTVPGSTTDLDVFFFRYAALENDNSAAYDWPSSGYWRVRKAKASAPVGFGKSNSSEFGLVAPRRGQQALTVTSAQAGWTTTRAVGIYYQDQDGNHRLKFNLTGTFTSATVTSVNFTLTGVTFKNVTNFYQACSGFWAAVANIIPRAYVTPNASTLVIDSASAAGATGIYVSGDVELDSKPTWA